MSLNVFEKLQGPYTDYRVIFCTMCNRVSDSSQMHQLRRYPGTELH